LTSRFAFWLNEIAAEIPILLRDREYRPVALENNPKREGHWKRWRRVKSFRFLSRCGLPWESSNPNARPPPFLVSAQDWIMDAANRSAEPRLKEVSARSGSQ
jgi:hypothetical protein